MQMGSFFKARKICGKILYSLETTPFKLLCNTSIGTGLTRHQETSHINMSFQLKCKSTQNLATAMRNNKCDHLLISLIICSSHDH